MLFALQVVYFTFLFPLFCRKVITQPVWKSYSQRLGSFGTCNVLLLRNEIKMHQAYRFTPLSIRKEKDIAYLLWKIAIARSTIVQ